MSKSGWGAKVTLRQDTWDKYPEIVSITCGSQKKKVAKTLTEKEQTLAVFTW